MIWVDIRKQLGDFNLAPVLAVDREITVLYGHSGAGKTLTLEAIAGLLVPDAGRIELDGRVVFDAGSGARVPPHSRNVGYLVQSYGLFPHLSVADNIGYGIPGLSVGERRARINEFVQLLRLEGLEDRKPEHISGGQAQRVALARALVRRPRVLLLDEPFAALDPSVRSVLRDELRRLVGDLGLSALLVTHDLTEAYNMGDRIAVIDQGAVLQIGPRDEVLNRPVSARAAEVVGIRNIVAGRLVASEAAGVVVDTPIGRVTAAGANADLAPPAKVHVAIRSERVLLERRDRPSRHDTNRFAVRIVDEDAFGASHILHVQVEGADPAVAPRLQVDIPAHPYDVMGVASQRNWFITIPPEAVHVIAE